jgi:uncharacterized protein YciI
MTLDPVEGFIYYFEPARPVAEWGDKEHAVAEQHFAHLKAATDAGKVLMAGRTLDQGGPAFVVFEAVDEAEAKAFMESDPFVSSGQVRPHLHPFRAALMRTPPA